MITDVENPKSLNWGEVVAAQERLFEMPTAKNVEQYRLIAGSLQDNTPFHIQPILRKIRQIQETTEKPAANIRILDHGCGGCSTLMFLAALGYTDVYGVDVGGPLEQRDHALRTLIEADEPRVRLYDGMTLPYSDATFDLIFSQQVLEHVKDRFIASFISEEVRTLGKKGIVYHQIPHRWTPWESHTKSWLVHYLPRSLQNPIYRALGHDPDYLLDMLHLRSPLYFYRAFRRAFSNCRNETLDRIAARADPSYYEGNIRLRNFIAQIAKLPIIRNVIVHLVMIDLTAGGGNSSE
jgi:SAM-dependent methyltransferase